MTTLVSLFAAVSLMIGLAGAGQPCAPMLVATVVVAEQAFSCGSFLLPRLFPLSHLQTYVASDVDICRIVLTAQVTCNCLTVVT